MITCFPEASGVTMERGGILLCAESRREACRLRLNANDREACRTCGQSFASAKTAGMERQR